MQVITWGARVFALLLVAMMTVGVWAQDPTPEVTETAEAPISTPLYTRLRFGQYAANSPNMDVYLNDRLAFRDVPFGSMTNYLTLDAALYRVTLVTTGGDPERDALLAPFDALFIPNRTYTLTFTGDIDGELASASTPDPASTADPTAELEPLPPIRADVIDETAIYEELPPGFAHVVVLPAVAGENVAVNASLGGNTEGLVGLSWGDRAVIHVPPVDAQFTLDVSENGAVQSRAQTEIELRGDLLYFLIAAGNAGDAQVFLQIAGTKNLAQLLSESPDFSLMYALIQQANLEETLRVDSPFTVFALRNDTLQAYMSANGLYSDTLLEDAAQVDALVRYHIARGLLFSDAIASTLRVPMLDGSDVIVTPDTSDATAEPETFAPGFTLNDTTRILLPDVLATNGVIHVIDSVLQNEVNS